MAVLRCDGVVLRSKREQVLAVREFIINGPRENKKNHILWRDCRPPAGVVGLCLNVRAQFRSGAESRGPRLARMSKSGARAIPATNCPN